jgi:hypothetical protein
LCIDRNIKGAAGRMRNHVREDEVSGHGGESKKMSSQNVKKQASKKLGSF